ncbi:MAG: type II toxin-antitoxin system VapC family toxin [Gemmataceae bacterium]
MSFFVVDTDTLTFYQTGHPNVVPTVDAHAPGAVRVTAVSVEEQFIGWYTYARQAKRPDQIALAYDGLTRSAASLARFTILTYSAAAQQRFRQLRKLLPRAGKNDLRIAAVALEHGATLVTHNVKDFAGVPGLVIVDWAS